MPSPNCFGGCLIRKPSLFEDLYVAPPLHSLIVICKRPLKGFSKGLSKAFNSLAHAFKRLSKHISKAFYSPLKRLFRRLKKTLKTPFKAPQKQNVGIAVLLVWHLLVRIAMLVTAVVPVEVLAWTDRCFGLFG